MSRTVRVDLGDRGYDIHIGRGFDSVLQSEGSGTTALLVSDSNVDPLYGDRCAELLTRRNFKVERAVVPAGEASKSLECIQSLFDHAISGRLDRRSIVVALGGGVVGDLSGFAAGTYLRGVKFLQVPTSLLAMVDSSVGGKTGVNLPQGKNLVGVFYQPVEVAVDLDTLATLPDREYLSGMAEVVKYGVIWDAPFFEMLESNVAPLRARDPDVLASIVSRCCEIKAEVVAQDERESGVRAILNYGHTLGHAIENACGYGQLLHGEAVSVGMVYAAELSCVCRGFSREDADRITRLLAALGLPVGRSQLPDGVPWKALRSAMASDKKARSAIPTFVLSDVMGSVAFNCDVPEDALEAAFSALV
ncbi:MAG: 3-dehydroquinate synthase [Verrucomicrobia bacterium]|nr:3-dehydroquinate synthase [Verrucomicrobiota bacterium]